MVEWLCKVYRGFMDFLTIGLLFINAIIGFFIGYSVIGYDDFGYGFAGALIGFGVTIILEIFLIPPLAILFSIDGRLQKIDDLLDEINNKQFSLKKSEASVDDIKSEKTISDEKKEETVEDLKSRIKSYDDLMNDPKIKEEAETMRKFYGKEAYEHYLEKKAKELGVEK